MKSANATKFDRKSGLASWRDLRFLCLRVNGGGFYALKLGLQLTWSLYMLRSRWLA
jgi:hypothetical protein